MACIVCTSRDNPETVEHIIPRSLGNLHYVLPKGVVCQKCNARFSRFENRVLSSTTFLEERRRLGLLRQRHDYAGHPLERSALVSFVLKMAYEGLYKSRRKIWRNLDEQILVDKLISGTDQPLFNDSVKNTPLRFRSIPGLIEGFRLRNNNLRLLYAEHQDQIWCKFQFGRIVTTIRIN